MLAFFTHFFAIFCGQNPEHTWAFGGDWLPCCQRCTGLYVGAAVATALHAWLKPRLTAWFLGLHGVCLLLMAPFGLYWIEQGPVLRSSSGVLFGFAVATFLWAPLGRTCKSPAGRLAVCSPAGRAVRLYTAGLAATLCLLPLAAAHGGPFAATALSATAFCGALALAALAVASVGMALFTAGKWIRRPAATVCALIR